MSSAYKGYYINGGADIGYTASPFKPGMPKITSKAKSLTIAAIKRKIDRTINSNMPSIVLDWKATPEESIAEVNKALAQAKLGVEFRACESGGDCYAFALRPKA